MVRKVRTNTTILGAVVALAAAVAGCGGSGRAIKPTPPAPPVRLQLTAPADGARTLSGSVSITGTVSPGDAAVLVSGRPVKVAGGSFSATVPVRPGFNVVDVIASTPRAAGAVGAVRVYRESLVTIPDVSANGPAQATARLRAIGLIARVHEGGGLLESLIPFVSPHVCQTAPGPGRAVAPGSVVTVQVAKLC